VNVLNITGTDATHAEHIETIKSRNYVGVRPDGRFVPGQLGMGLVEGSNRWSTFMLYVGYIMFTLTSTCTYVYNILLL
jgi:DNA topoisomerase IA